MDNRTIKSSIASIVLGIFVIAYSKNFNEQSALFPTVISYVLIGLSLYAIVFQLIKDKKDGINLSLVFKELIKFDYKSLIKIVPIVILTFVYIALFDTVGFVILSPIYAVITGTYLGYKNILKLAIISVAFSVVVFLIFKYLLAVPLIAFF